MDREYAGTDLVEIRSWYTTERGYTGVVETKADGFTLYRPHHDKPAHDCAQVVVWPRRDGGGYWAEEY